MEVELLCSGDKLSHKRPAANYLLSTMSRHRQRCRTKVVPHRVRECLGEGEGAVLSVGFLRGPLFTPQGLQGLLGPAI